MCFLEGVDFKGGLRCIDQFLGQEGQILVNGEIVGVRGMVGERRKSLGWGGKKG